METVNAYAAVGSYRGAAALCGTTHKTVKRVLERLEAGQLEPACHHRVTRPVSATWSPRRCRPPTAASQPSGSCRRV